MSPLKKEHWHSNFWNQTQNEINLYKINLVGWNIIWDESQFGMSKNYSHFLWIWRVLHIFPTSCYGSGCELPKCLNYFHAKLLQDWTLTFRAKFTFWILLFVAWILNKRNNASGRFWIMLTTHIFLIEGNHTVLLLSSKTLCPIWFVAWGKWRNNVPMEINYFHWSICCFF